MQRTKTRLCFTIMLILLALSAASTAQKKDKEKANAASAANLPAVIWRDPGDVASLNLLYGAGGKEHAPDPNGKFTFVKEDTQGTSPKFDVADEQGVEWKKATASRVPPAEAKLVQQHEERLVLEAVVARPI